LNLAKFCVVVTAITDIQSFQTCVREFAAGVVLVTSRNREGKPVGLTSRGFSPVSSQPPLVLWSLARTAPLFNDYASAPAMAIHALHADQQALAEDFGTNTDEAFAAQASLQQGIGGIPVLPGAVAVLECVPWQQYDGGDHIIHVCRVERFSRNGGPPLLWHADKHLTSIPPTPKKDSAKQRGFVDNYLPYLIGRAGFEINSSFSRLLRQHDIQPAQWRVLATLTDRHMSVGELASIVLLKQPTLTKLLDRMESDGLVIRENHPEDRRKVLLNATASGRRVARKMTKLALQHEQYVLEQVPELERPEVEQALRGLIECLAKND